MDEGFSGRRRRNPSGTDRAYGRVTHWSKETWETVPEFDATTESLSRHSSTFRRESAFLRRTSSENPNNTGQKQKGPPFFYVGSS